MGQVLARIDNQLTPTSRESHSLEGAQAIMSDSDIEVYGPIIESQDSTLTLA
jgi:hypothetical protein